MRKLLCLFILLIVHLVFGQTKEQLEKERKRIIQEIEKTNKFLETTTKNKQTTLKDIKAISSQVDNRKKLISTISGEINASDRKIERNNKSIDSLSYNLSKLQSQYLGMQRYTYLRAMSNNKWSYLLSSGNLNTFLLRWRYMSQFESFNNSKRAEIQSLQNKINQSNQEIVKVKDEKGKLLAQEKINTLALEKEKQAKDKMLVNITSKENALRSELKSKKAEREKLNGAIERMIAAQLKAAREKAVAEHKNDSKQGKERKLDDATTKLSEEFSQNKNKLPWPISSGFVSSKFGVQNHPTLKGITIENNGIDIAARGSKDVKVVFDGTVVGVTKIPGYNHMVIISHGSYFSVYSKLDNVFVKQGQKLSGQQLIGKIDADQEGNAELHFELWKEDKTKLNPESWLR